MPGRRWTPDEDDQLRKMLGEGIRAEEIAARLGRKQRTDIYSRAQRLSRKRSRRPERSEVVTSEFGIKRTQAGISFPSVISPKEDMVLDNPSRKDTIIRVGESFHAINNDPGC